MEWTGYPSEKQHDLVVKIYREQVAKAQEATEPEPTWIAVPANLFDGRHQITGTILGTKLKESMYGSTWKMIVRVDTDAGSYKLWGSIPSDLDAVFDSENRRWIAGAGKGDVVTFMARVDPANWSDDEAFGAFERPTKASFVERADTTGEDE